MNAPLMGAWLVLAWAGVTAQVPAPPQPPDLDAVAPLAPPEPPSAPDVVAPLLPLAPRAPKLTEPGPDAIHLTARRLDFDARTATLHLSGGVTLVAPDRTLAAQDITLNVNTGELHATGPLVMADETQVVRCNGAVMNLKTVHGSLREVQVDVYEPMDAAARTAVATLGTRPPQRRTATATGAVVTLQGRDKLHLTSAYVTTCDCEQGPAPFSVRARSATVATGDYALMWLPTVQILDVPVMVLPLWVMPLGSRQSGLLFPQIRLQDGLWLSQPVFLTLGNSADVTVAPAVVTERGPRLYLEGRAAPAHGTYLEAQFTYQRDAKHLWQRRDPGQDRGIPGFLPARAEDQLGVHPSYTARGEQLEPNRFAGRLLGHSTVGPAAMAVDANMVSDRYVPGDFGASLGDRVAPYLRSTAAVSGGIAHVAASLAVQTFQDLNQPDVLFYGSRSAALGQRIPSLRVRVLEAPVLPALGGVGPAVMGRALVALDQERVLGVGESREVFDQPGRMPGATRLTLQPELVLPVSAGRFGGLRAAVGVREALLLGADGRIADVTRAYARARAETELTGRLGGFATHHIRPYLAYDGTVYTRSSATGGNQPWLDEADRMDRYQVLGAGLYNDVTLEGILGRRAYFAADVRAAADVFNLSRSEAQLMMRAEILDSSAFARLVLDPWRRELTFAQVGLDVGTGKTAQVHFGYTRVAANAPRFMVAGADELLGGIRLSGPSYANASDRLDAFVAVPVGRVRLDYGAEVAFPGLEGGNVRDPATLLTHGGGIAYESDCKCWQAGVRMRFWPDSNGQMRTIPDLGLQLSITGPGGEMALFR